jgi:hypothetical protein
VLIDHAIDESTRMFAGTKRAHDDFMMYHDALTAWWEKEAIDYIASRGFAGRFISSLSPTNDSTRYALKMVGDSPEICRGLDSHGFSYTLP